MAIRSLTIGCLDEDLKHTARSVHITSCSPFAIEMWEEGSKESFIISTQDIITALNVLEVDNGKSAT